MCFVKIFQKLLDQNLDLSLQERKKCSQCRFIKLLDQIFFGIVSITTKIEKRWCCIILKTTYFQSIHNSKNKKSFLIILNFLSFDSYVVRQIKTYLFAYRYFSTAQIFTYKNKLVDKIEKFTIYFLFFNVSYCVSKIMLIFILVIQQPYNCIFLMGAQY